MIAILEALEWMLTKRSEIVRSFYVAIGHDEEGRGLDGAAKIAEFMREYRLDDIEFILDEGPYIFQDSITGVRRNVAMIGIAEKGLINIRLTAKSSVGHSSLPPQKTSIVKLAEAVSRFKSTAHPNRFGQGPERETIESLAPYCSLFYKILYTNLWLFGPLVGYLLENDPLLSSLIRTSTAVTIFKGGVKDNVLPSEAEAIINHRIYPLDSIETVLEFDRNLINDPEIQLEQLGMAVEPHPISPAGKQAFGYQTILKSIQQVFPAVAVVPGVMYAATDTRWYLNFTKNIYRFSPGYLSLENLSIVHGHNERNLNSYHFN
ncbi:carboxypeptidase PM20D1-like protein [Sarcoptes scabiei]|uniref:Carboxypeptidase PM20D1-like protein n=1 Tax=Sarcoptes scabiei TaxID=52283 RepID=A0A132A2F6_SARSC|nr:carboxypeptidase PM20D1-like protein [Sarcoptes scabiei]